MAVWLVGMMFQPFCQSEDGKTEWPGELADSLAEFVCNFAKTVMKLPISREDPKKAPKRSPESPNFRGFVPKRPPENHAVRPGLGDQSAMFEHPQAAGVETKLFGKFLTKLE